MGVMSTLESNAAVLRSINHAVGRQLLQRLQLLLLLLETIATYCLESATQLRATPCTSLLMPQ